MDIDRVIPLKVKGEWMDIRIVGGSRNWPVNVSINSRDGANLLTGELTVSARKELIRVLLDTL